MVKLKNMLLKLQNYQEHKDIILYTFLIFFRSEFQAYLAINLIAPQKNTQI